MIIFLHSHSIIYNPKLFVLKIQKKLSNYQPQSVRRKYIEKENGKLRPLGIPTITDRIIQQCIKQVMEPICESKFYNHSYGFRPNRSTHHAISRVMTLVQKANLHYVVDIDIKGFFDNVNHGKLLKQIWNIGIQDKQILAIISKLLKSEIQGEGIPIKGTPQGGILSPLLSNIVLNELDWWISNQWETFKSDFPYRENHNKYAALKKTNLKEMYIVRYADDFKILCRDSKTAFKIYNAVKKWLLDRLGLEISPEKSKVTNLRKNYTEFLGIKIKAVPKGKKIVCQSHMTDKSIMKVSKKLREYTVIMQKSPTVKSVQRYNAVVLGCQNYYKIATNVNLDFTKIYFLVRRTLYNRLKNISKPIGAKSKAYYKFYGNYNMNTPAINGIQTFPVEGVSHWSPLNFSQNICNYTKIGRDKIHNNLQGVNNKIIEYLLNTPVMGQTVEYNDNRLSLYIGQKGKCEITDEALIIGDMETHHKTPKELGGKDDYKNLCMIKLNVHKLIHATKSETIEKYVKKLNLNERAMKKLNKFRVLVGNTII
ncbi:group II intron reverse transcriptase/maturase [Clostridium felsineum]|uniref:Uncharacterized protein n=1 Tax=Clostridium felsineum TaxID=36839 RepID=A0A1S8MEU0_9CLOT|nr:group II intron reverse transcriptase/maturase [Clostridium felsineum]URZ07423.1 hypothetical protein CLROS_027610 [Clostridium felsineum]URZ12454.1 hypothetical protein CROST_031760 [Clostridium felsineum]